MNKKVPQFELNDAARRANVLRLKLFDKVKRTVNLQAADLCRRTGSRAVQLLLKAPEFFNESGRVEVANYDPVETGLCPESINPCTDGLMLVPLSLFDGLLDGAASFEEDDILEGSDCFIDIVLIEVAVVFQQVLDAQIEYLLPLFAVVRFAYLLAHSLEKFQDGMAEPEKTDL